MKCFVVDFRQIADMRILGKMTFLILTSGIQHFIESRIRNSIPMLQNETSENVCKTNLETDRFYNKKKPQFPKHARQTTKFIYVKNSNAEYITANNFKNSTTDDATTCCYV